MSDDDTLDTLVRVSRHYRVRERRLCCPECGGDVELVGGTLMCTQGEGVARCFWAGAKLAELAVRP